MQIRAFRDGDEVGVRALPGEDAPDLYRWKLTAMHGPGRDEPSRWRTEVAVAPDGDIRGAVTLAHHSIHQGQYVLVVQVAPEHRRRGLGRQLVGVGRRMRTTTLPMTAQFFASDAASAALLRAEGAEIIQRTPGFVLMPERMRAWCDAQPVPPGVVVGSLAGLPVAELAAAWLDRYVWVHEGWTAPPLSMPALSRTAAALAAEVDRDAAAGAWVDGRLAALATVWIDPAGSCELSAETVRRDEPDGTALVAAVLADSLRRLADRGVTAVQLDGHVTDAHLHPVTLTFPADIAADPLLVARLD